TQENIDTGNGAAPSSFSVIHEYQDARIDVEGEGFLGFGTHTTTDLRNGAKVRTTYNFAANQPFVYGGQYHYPDRGMPIATLSYITDGGKWHAREVVTTYSEKGTSNGGSTCNTHFVYPRAVEDRTFELSSAPVDGNGNITTLGLAPLTRTTALRS